MSEFSPEEEDAIEEKIELLSPLFETGLTQEEFLRRAKSIEGRIIEKRLKWFQENKPSMDYLAREDLSDLQKATGLLYGHYMGIFRDIRIIPLEDEVLDCFYAVHIASQNFCPYLEAMKRMNVSYEQSVWVCQNVLEKPCQVLIEQISPHIKFTRDYFLIRPVHTVCIERLSQTHFPEFEEFVARWEKENP